MDIFHEVDAGPLIHAAFASGERFITLRPATRWVSELWAPSNVHVLGDASVILGDGSAFFNVGPGTTLEGVTINDPNTTPGKRVGFTANYSQGWYVLSAPNHDPFSVALSGPPGASDHNGYSAVYEDQGTGDLFFGKVAATTTEWRDAIYRGDMHGGGPSGNGIGPGKVFAGYLWAGTHPSAQGLEIRDERESQAARQFKLTALHGEAGMQFEQSSSGSAYVFAADHWGDFTIKNDTTGTPALVLMRGGEVQLRQHDIWWGFDFGTGQWVRRR